MIVKQKTPQNFSTSKNSNCWQKCKRIILIFEEFIRNVQIHNNTKCIATYLCTYVYLELKKPLLHSIRSVIKHTHTHMQIYCGLAQLPHTSMVDCPLLVADKSKHTADMLWEEHATADRDSSHWFEREGFKTVKPLMKNYHFSEFSLHMFMSVNPWPTTIPPPGQGCSSAASAPSSADAGLIRQCGKGFILLPRVTVFVQPLCAILCNICVLPKN